ncbi:hypothetical protein Hanom_Chr02g00140851 [Helianthus anomalus]
MFAVILRISVIIVLLGPIGPRPSHMERGTLRYTVRKRVCNSGLSKNRYVGW